MKAQYPRPDPYFGKLSTMAFDDPPARTRSMASAQKSTDWPPTIQRSANLCQYPIECSIISSSIASRSLVVTSSRTITHALLIILKLPCRLDLAHVPLAYGQTVCRLASTTLITASARGITSLDYCEFAMERLELLPQLLEFLKTPIASLVRGIFDILNSFFRRGYI